MAMDVSRAQNAMSLPQVSANDSVPSSGERDQVARNATAQMQARYGEKPKEARAVKKALDKDDFMRIMITEMTHQDPTKPMDADKMATQMAQITSVEQLKNVSGAIEKLADKNSASDRLAMSAMIGKSVVVDKGRFSHQKGTLSPINFNLPRDANRVKMSILDERGEEVATRELEPMKAGTNVYNWDGMNVSGLPTSSGNFIVRIDAEDAKGSKIQIDPISSETVVGVSFEGGETNFLVGDSKTPQKVNFRNVIRIEGDAPARTSQTATDRKAAPTTASSAAPKAATGAEAQASAPASNEGFALPESLQQKLGLQAEGFPNGLKD